MSSPINIDSRGYGRIYKAVMRNRQLPILAKAIYAYFCAYAGNGYQAYPKRDKIIRDLRMNKDTYTKHLNCLVAERYIAKERTAAGNLYTIMQTVPGYEKSNRVDEDMTDMLIMENVGAQGFGTVPKLLMLDSKLTAQAKAIYAYFASFAGAGTTAFPRRATIMRDLGLSQATYYKHYNLLLSYGYLSVEQRKNNGKYTVSLYRLSDCVAPPDIPPSRHNTGKRKAMSEKIAHDEMLKASHPLSEKPLSEKMVHGNFGQADIKNNSKTNSSSEKEQVYYHQGATPDDIKPVPLFSPKRAKETMRYDSLQSEAMAWGELKETLGHFSDPADKMRYLRRVNEILEEIAKQVCEFQNPEHIATVTESEAFAEFFENILTHWDEIRSANGYVRASLRNIINRDATVP